MPTTCLICCQQAEYFLLPPCNHKQMCWKCCVTLIEGSTFTCPYCNGTPQGTSAILFVNEEQMNTLTFQQVFKRNPFKSAAKSYQYYSNADVANFIEQSTSNYCRLCMNSFDNMNFLKKHLNQVHRRQFCDVCLQNRKCLLSEQYLYNEAQLTSHMKKGQYSQQHQLILYHPYCQFCKIRFYDIDTFRAHLRISSHLRCHICQQNYPKLKYVYYKDYPQIQKHFYKSHFVCDIGACLINKLQNVFVSQNLLQQHKYRIHNKGNHHNNHKNNNNNNKQILNILFFQNNQQQFQWDKIGKDLQKQFIIAQKTYILKNQQHYDGIIDIRQFYPQLTRYNNKMSIQQIKIKLQQYLFKSDYKTQYINFTSVPIFMPLQMTNIMRYQIQNLLRSIFQPKYSQSIIQIFFTRKFQYKSQNQYFHDIRRKMWNFCPISYYYIFPQLIRFFKNTNKTKQHMDQFYAQSLRSLKINKIFIFHKKQRYSDIFNILQQQIQAYLYELMIEQKINLQVYKRYLKDLNPQFYHTNHSIIFYVQKQKIKNMYHMIEKTKTSELLKFNWLLKLGLSNNSHKIIYDKFFYKTVDDCNEWIYQISLQQLALVYAYIQICLQSLIDKSLFNVSKLNSPTLFLGTLLSKIKTCISNKDLTVLKHLQTQSIQIAAKLNHFVVVQNKKKKGTIINQEDHPSLLNNDDKNKKQQNIQNFVAFGKNVSVTPNSNIRVNKKNNNKVQQPKQQFPQLFIKKPKQTKKQKTQQEQFPVFNYLQQNQTKKVPKKKAFLDEQQEKSKSNIEKYDLFNPKNAFPSKKITDDYYKNKQKEIADQNQNDIRQTKWGDWPTFDQQYSKQQPEQTKTKNTKKKKKKDNTIQSQQKLPEATTQQFSEQLFIKKKTKQQLRAEQQATNKKQKRRNRQPTPQKQPTKKLIEKPAQQQNKPVKRKKKIRADQTDSSVQQRKKKQEKQKEREEKHRKFLQQQELKQSLKYHMGFDSLLSKTETNQKTKQKSIINNLIEQNKKQQKQPQILIKRGKKGKAVVIERFNIFG